MISSDSHLHWIGLALGAFLLAAGALDWYRGRGYTSLISGVTFTALGLGTMLGETHSTWEYVCLAVAGTSSIYGLIARRRAIRWRGPGMISLAVFVVTIAAVELLSDVFHIVPSSNLKPLMWVVVVSLVISITAPFWEAPVPVRRDPAPRPDADGAR
jgi:hypothetical protein